MNDPRARKLYESRDRYENAQAERKEFINMMVEKLKRDFEERKPEPPQQPKQNPKKKPIRKRSRK